MTDETLAILREIATLLLPTLGVVLVLSAFPSKAAPPPGEIQAACTDDAQRLCAVKDLLVAAGGSYGAINACFKVNNAKLSSRCRAALAKSKP